MIEKERAAVVADRDTKGSTPGMGHGSPQPMPLKPEQLSGPCTGAPSIRKDGIKGANP